MKSHSFLFYFHSFLASIKEKLEGDNTILVAPQEIERSGGLLGERFAGCSSASGINGVNRSSA